MSFIENIYRIDVYSSDKSSKKKNQAAIVNGNQPKKFTLLYIKPDLYLN